MTFKITAPKGAMVHYLVDSSDHELFDIHYDPIGMVWEWICEKVVEECAGESLFVELRVQGKQRYWKFEWDLASFEHTPWPSCQHAIQNTLIPWYLCVEYERNKYALYKMDSGIDEAIVSERHDGPNHHGSGYQSTGR